MNSSADGTLTELELDALTELVNLGVSRAAMSLREMVGEQVILSVPAVNLVPRAEAIDILAQRERSRLVAVHQSFDGEIAGHALLIFPETKSLQLVRAIAGGELSLEDIMDLEPEALAETGNVILNACLATVANSLSRTFKVSLPEVIRGTGTDLFSLSRGTGEAEVVMFLYIDFAVRKQDISGYVAMLMDMPSMHILKGLLGKLIEETGAPPTSVELGPV